MESGFDRINFTSTAELIEESHIYKLPVVSVILAALLDNSFLAWERGEARLTNNHVVKLAVSPLSENVIVRVIGAYASEFDTSDRSLLALKRNGVSDKVIAAMLSKATASGGVHAAEAGKTLPAQPALSAIQRKHQQIHWSAGDLRTLASL